MQIEEEMPDTLRGRLVYRKHDSTGVLQSAGQDLAIAWRRPAKKEKEKEKKDDAPEPNPFKVKVAGGTTLNPEKNIVFDFDYPLTRVDSTAIDLQRLGEGESSEAAESLLRAGHRKRARGRSARLGWRERNTV